MVLVAEGICLGMDLQCHHKMDQPEGQLCFLARRQQAGICSKLAVARIWLHPCILLVRTMVLAEEDICLGMD
jgi:hypothetical protein